MITNWRYSEPALAKAPINFGSGYPSDPTCKAWMKEQLSDSVFGFADAVRFSWGPTKKQLLTDATAVTFSADVEVDGDGEDNKHQILLGKKRQQENMSDFLSGKSKLRRLPYFERKKLSIVTTL